MWPVVVLVVVVSNINSCGLVLSGTIVSIVPPCPQLVTTLLHNSFRSEGVCCSCRDDECLWLAVKTVHSLVARVTNTITGLLWRSDGLVGLEILVGIPPQVPGRLQSLLAVTAGTVGLS